MHSQIVQHRYGDTVYIDRFNIFADGLGLSDIFDLESNRIIRIWNGGKAISIEKTLDTILGVKAVYDRGVKKHIWRKERFFFEDYDLSFEDCMLVNDLAHLDTVDFTQYQWNTDSIERRDGGNATAIELKKGDSYLIITGELFSQQQRDLVDVSVRELDLDSLEYEFEKSLPGGYTFNVGGTTSLHKMSKCRLVFHRLAFWKY